MRFKVDGVEYVLEFQHAKKKVRVMREGISRMVESRYPYTTTVIRKVVEGKRREEWPLIYRHEVGCCRLDSYSKQTGNLFALKGLTNKIKPEVSWHFIRAMWDTYNCRREAAMAAQAKAEAAKLAKTAMLLDPYRLSEIG